MHLGNGDMENMHTAWTFLAQCFYRPDSILAL